MKKVSLGKPLATTVVGQVDWILRALHQIELASSVKDTEFDTLDARLAVIETRLDGIDTSIVDIEARLDALEP